MSEKSWNSLHGWCWEYHPSHDSVVHQMLSAIHHRTESWQVNRHRWSQLLEQYHFYMDDGWISQRNMEDWENQYQAHSLGERNPRQQTGRIIETAKQKPNKEEQDNGTIEERLKAADQTVKTVAQTAVARLVHLPVGDVNWLWWHLHQHLLAFRHAYKYRRYPGSEGE